MTRTTMKNSAKIFESINEPINLSNAEQTVLTPRYHPLSITAESYSPEQQGV